MKVKLFTDAAIRGVNKSTETPKRGRAAIAFIIVGDSGKVVKQGGLKLPETASVSEAEYSGLIAGLHNASLAGATEVDVYMDSQLVIRQMLGEYAIRAGNLREYADEVKEKAAQFKQVTYNWVARDFNSEADGLANQYLEGSIR